MAQRPNQKGGSHRGWWGALGGALSYWLWRRWRSGGQKKAGAVHQRSLEDGYEQETTSTPGVLIAAVLVVLLVAVSVWGTVEFENRLGGRAAASSPASDIADVDLGADAGVPPPRLQVDPGLDLQDLHREEHDRLYTYGRLDSTRLHIPIGRAMKLIAERGLPADSSAQDDSMRVPTESGFRFVHRRRFPSEPPPYLGSSPEPYTPATAFRRRLTGEGYLPRPDSAR